MTIKAVDKGLVDKIHHTMKVDGDILFAEGEEIKQTLTSNDMKGLVIVCDKDGKDSYVYIDADLDAFIVYDGGVDSFLDNLTESDIEDGRTQGDEMASFLGYAANEDAKMYLTDILPQTGAIFIKEDIEDFESNVKMSARKQFSKKRIVSKTKLFSKGQMIGKLLSKQFSNAGTSSLEQSFKNARENVYQNWSIDSSHSQAQMPTINELVEVFVQAGIPEKIAKCLVLGAGAGNNNIDDVNYEYDRIGESQLTSQTISNLINSIFDNIITLHNQWKSTKDDELLWEITLLTFHGLNWEYNYTDSLEEAKQDEYYDLVTPLVDDYKAWFSSVETFSRTRNLRRKVR